MTDLELASLLQWREEVVQLEMAHIKLANKVFRAVDPELADMRELDDEQAQVDLLTDIHRPFVDQFGTQRSVAFR